MTQYLILATSNKNHFSEITKFISDEFPSLEIKNIDNLDELKNEIQKNAPVAVLTDLKLYSDHKQKLLTVFDTVIIRDLLFIQHNLNVLAFESENNIDQAAGFYRAGIKFYFQNDFSKNQLIQVIKKLILLNEIINLQGTPFRSKKFTSEEIGDYSISVNSKLEEVYLEASKIAKYNSEVLILGESGVGKEHLAEFIHNQSRRNSKPFKVIDLSSYPENIIESTLFGHTRGAFTGATESKYGLVHYASGGTLFIDEIGNASLNIQAKLLRFIESKQYRMLGAVQEYTADIRIIAATNKSVRELRDSENFRNDLFNRLDKNRITIPSLRERTNHEKIELARFISSSFAKSNNTLKKEFDAEALEIIITHNWPGNVRNMNKIISIACMKSEGDYINGALIKKIIDEDLKESF